MFLDILPWVCLDCLQMFTYLLPCCWLQTCCLENPTSNLSCYKNRTFQWSELLLWTNQYLFYDVFFVLSSLAQHVRGKYLQQASAVNETLQFLTRSNSYSWLFSLRIKSYEFLSANAKYSESVSMSISSEMSVSRNFVRLLY